ncbi:carboxypeptidase-like regulatory domain-containing protein [Lewinella sp. JB7]|uniref:carboxypeptidase-like regulatory domain-containing protein n=1 Tax=Lewinella sp. JB7 TaxID=2962887 RepID=UPI0020CA08C3|nr:carboxypeptidase-like regulatory domain-containing protein [Lewinella sp. JB7]MCP9234652.1 carboxypeptidase-like regulatory domain-containing protein [Lewinella sp. JB7]
MLPNFTAYPQFAPNQILTSGNLNQLYDYLGEQERLTRTHLIGIGIVCGLEATLNDAGTQLTISRGCGVTSAGHLIIWDEDEPLEFRRPYTMPDDIDYDFFDLPDNSGDTYPLWELTTDRDDDGEAVALDHDFLTGINQDTDAGEGDEKVLLLLFECRVRDNSNCTPTSCDDKGQTVETAIRPLLARRRDIEEIRRVLALDNPGVEAYYALFQTQAERLGLVTLRGPRFDVMNTRPATTRQLFEAYRTALSAPLLARVQSALDAAYTALAPLLSGHPANPFAGLVTGLSHLHDGSLLQSVQALSYQYYFDHLATIIAAYDELRDRAEDLFGLCCPDDRIFPRHLVLHHFTANGISNDLRHVWVSSPVQNRQSEAGRELASLFARLVALVQPTELPTAPLRQTIRITPSFLGRPLSDKAIPYYYDASAVLTYWNYRLTRRGRADQNLGYDAPTWNATDDFVRRPLVYDPEPRNFLRIEGAVGQPFPMVVKELRDQITAFRLPIDLVALRTGNLGAETNVADHALHFADLESQYATFRAGLLGRLAEVAVRFYDTKILDDQGQAQPPTLLGTPRAPLLQRLGSYRYLRGTVGEFYEQNYDLHTAASPFGTGLNGFYFVHLLAIHRMVRLEDSFALRLRDLDFSAAENALSTIQGGGRFFARVAALGLNDAQSGGVTTNPKIDLEEYSDQLDELITAGDLDALRALYDTYVTRRKEVLERQLFVKFQDEHPGLQFRAGAPPGGTFVLVYHGEGRGDGTAPRTGSFRIAGRVLIGSQPVPGVTVVVRDATIGTVTNADGRFSLTVNNLPVTLRLSLSFLVSASREYVVTREEDFHVIDLLGNDQPTGETPIPGIRTNIVIADFYLPYRCCGSGAPIHVFPPTPPEPPAEELRASLEQAGCSSQVRERVTAPVRFTASGGVPPYFIRDANGNRQPLPPDPIVLPNGAEVTVTDNDGQEVPLTVALLPVLSVQLVGSPNCADDNLTYTHDFTVSGGKPPYQFTQPDGTSQRVETNEVATISGIPSGKGFDLTVTDDSPEPCSQTIDVPAHTCDVTDPECGLPCGGIATRQSYPLWAQQPVNESVVYEDFRLTVDDLRLTTADGNVFAFDDPTLRALNRNIAVILSRNQPLTLGNFGSAMQPILESIMKSVDADINGPIGLENDERSLQLSADVAERFNRLTAEFFTCDRFELRVSVGYVETQGSTGTKVERAHEYEYTNDGVRPGGENEPFPAFDRFRIDRCDRDADPRPQCEKELSVTIEFDADGRDLFLDAQPSDGVDEPVFWWDIPLAEPGLAIGKSVTSRYANIEGHSLIWVLMVDPETGCFAVDSHDDFN